MPIFVRLRYDVLSFCLSFLLSFFFLSKSTFISFIYKTKHIKGWCGIKNTGAFILNRAKKQPLSKPEPDKTTIAIFIVLLVLHAAA